MPRNSTKAKTRLIGRPGADHDEAPPRRLPPVRVVGAAAISSSCQPRVCAERGLQLLDNGAGGRPVALADRRVERLQLGGVLLALLGLQGQRELARRGRFIPGIFT